MFLGDNQDMGRALWIQVFEGKGMLVFINFLGGDFAADNTAE
jgi:hypothetical protein